MVKKVAVLVTALLACERSPFFKQPPTELGGFVVRCTSVTDFAAGTRPGIPQGCVGQPADPQLDGGCACAQPGIALGMPALNCPSGCSPLDATEIVSALTFADTNCTTITADTCLPYVIPTDPAYDESTAPAGQIRLDKLARRIPERLTMPQPFDFTGGSTDGTIQSRAARDSYVAIRDYCLMAQWGVLVEQLYGYPRGSAQFASAHTLIGGEFAPKTSTLNGDQLASNDWGTATLSGLKPSLYVTHVFRPYDPNLTPCNSGRVHPFGLAAITEFVAPAASSNPPSPRVQVTGRIAARQSVRLDASSSGILTVSGVENPIPLTLRGAIDISLSDCSEGGCIARLESVAVSAMPFTAKDMNVTALDLISSKEATGILQGDLLAFDSFDGSIRAHLDDGRWDTVPVTAGVLLARWKPDENQFVMAFSFTGSGDADTSATLDGTLTGSFLNTAPRAVAEVIGATRVSDVATIECSGPTGTDVLVDGSGSLDREDGHPTLAWYEGETRTSTASKIQMSALPLGSKHINLMAYDSYGFATNDPLTISVVDSKPPTIEASSICVYPPNHSHICLRLFDEISVQVHDECMGDISGTASITAVTTESGDPVASWNAQEVCFVAEKARAGETRHEVTIGVTDANGNTAEKTISVVVPHDMRHHPECLKTPNLERGSWR